MIKENTPLSITESLEYMNSKNESEEKVKIFMEKFKKLDLKKAQSLREKIERMELLKVKDSEISKIIDLVPENKESLNKIFTDVSLTEEESKQILDSIEEFR
jgi:DNA-directed RNA polymerase subunit F